MDKLKWAMVSLFVLPVFSAIVGAEEVSNVKTQEAIKKEVPSISDIATSNGVNLIEEGSSFETGWDGFSCMHLALWSQRDVPADPVFDTSTSVDGKTSLKFSGKGRHSFRLSFKPFVLKPGKTFNLSFYAKASQSNVTFLLRVKSFTHDSHDMRPLTANATVGTEWKRYVFSFNSPGEDAKNRSLRDRYYLEFDISQENTRVGGRQGVDFGNIWLDAVQLEEGGATAYHPGQDVDIGIAAPNGGKKIYYVGETPGEAEASIYSGQASGKAVLNYKIMDYYFDTEISKGQTAIELVPGKTAGARIKLDKQVRGIYKLIVSLDQAGKTLSREELAYGFITPAPADSDFDRNSFFGGLMHAGYFGRMGHFTFWTRESNPDQELVTQLPAEWIPQLAEDIGMKFIRPCGAFEADYSTARAEPGKNFVPMLFKGEKYNFAQLEELTALWRKHHIYFMPVLDATDWMYTSKPNKVVNLEIFGDYVQAMVKACPSVEYWETWNEPNNSLRSPKHFFDLNKVAYEAIKKANPKAKVVALSATSDQGGDVVGWVKSGGLFDMGVQNYLDIVSVHIYEEPDLARRLGKEVVDFVNKKKPGTEVWDTEAGIWGTCMYPDVMSVITDNSARNGGNPSPQDQARSLAATELAMMIGGISKHLPIEFDGFADKIHETFYFQWIEYDRAPRPALVAYDAMTDMLGKAKLLKEIILGGNYFCGLFDRAGTPVVALVKSGYQVKPENAVVELKPSDIEVFNIMGNPLKLEERDGKAVLPISDSLIYIVGAKVSAGRLEQALSAMELDSPLAHIEFIRLSETDGKPELAVGIKNEGAVTGLSGSIAVTKKPDGWEFPKSVEFPSIPIRETDIVSVPVLCLGPDGNNEFTVELTSGKKKVTGRDMVRLSRAGRMQAPVQIDGNTDEWEKITGLRIEKSTAVILCKIKGDLNQVWRDDADLSATVKIGYDEENMYLLAEVKDDRVFMDPEVAGQIKEPGKADYIYQADCLELFFDTQLGKDLTSDDIYNDDDVQLLVAPVAENNPIPRLAKSSRGGGNVYVDLTKIKVVSKFVAGGYVIEAAFPLKTTFPFLKLALGAMIGFSVAIDDDDVPGYVPDERNIMQLGRELQACWTDGNPAQFGVLLFE